MSTKRLVWFKSSYSSGDGDSCVEVAAGAHGVHVRDSKVQDGPRISLSPAAWAEFVGFAPQG
ncbi:MULTISPECIES: DUF397 domain-containing protein [Streptomyces]|uniref:DUF397 domain-containing protein n=1 Tax=Streptomyces TaxID=1883 RepID=UPI001675982A|nr:MULTISPECIES: DUF397 domain-containing protein [Streptomyces]MBD3576158.1 DUF397 domain-containing protein [Streptomyces sp. KD18]GGS97620.1 DUF397 domain-containing protein [Streptomyces toxytricini]